VVLRGSPAGALTLLVALLGCRAKERAESAPPPALQDSAPAFVADCRPCRLLITRGQAPWDFRFVIDSTAEGRRVAAIEARQETGSALARLEVHGMLPVSPGEQFFFGGTDLDRDGHLDLLLATVRGVANTYADYWRFAPDSNRFRYLGNFPIFTRDSATGRLQTYERGGEGGRAYQAREWAVVGDTLVVMREEVEEATARPGQFLRITRVRPDSLSATLKEARRERVRDSS
jgi:hypothetical protein